jgi:DNA modification methylase
MSVIYPEVRQRHQRQNSHINKLDPQDRPVHRWYRFVLSFPPHLVQDYLEKFAIAHNQTVLDPFCGTGTTLVECKKLGISSVGIEANPMAHFASQVKLDWSPDPDRLIAHATQVAEAAQAQLASTGFDDNCDFEQVKHLLQELPSESQKLLLKGSISPIPLHKTLVLLNCLQQDGKQQYHQHERLALASVLVNSISNLEFGPEVGIAPSKVNVPVVDVWLAAVSAIAEDLRQLGIQESRPAVVHYADSRQILTVLAPNSIDAVITSPPYPNEKDYSRATRLELVLLGFIHNKAELRALKGKLIRSNTRGVYKQDQDDHWVAEHPEIQHIAAAIEARRIQLGKTSGFERLYARTTKLYFGGMARHLAELRSILRPGAQLAYIVGDQASYLRVMIRTGQLLADVAQSLGYELVRIDLFRTRRATTTGEELREEAVVLRWPGP